MSTSQKAPVSGNVSTSVTVTRFKIWLPVTTPLEKFEAASLVAEVVNNCYQLRDCILPFSHGRRSSTAQTVTVRMLALVILRMGRLTVYPVLLS